MINLSEFKIGDKLEVLVYKIDVDGNKKVLPLLSQLADITDDLLFISMPLVHGVPYKLKRNSKIRIIIYREEKGIYSFSGEIVSMVQKNIIMYGVRPISDIEKEQRRFYYRLQIRSKMIIKSLDRDFTETCVTKDLSGGGARISCKSEFNKNESLNCFINLVGEIVNAKGVIVRKEKDFGDNNIELGIKFTEIQDTDRNKIVSFIFKEQRLLRKKGLI